MVRAIRALSFLLFGAAEAADRSFTDDKGNTFATSAEKPTIVTWAHTAVSMKHYGLDAAQLLGTYGEWYNTGSDIDFEKPEMGSSFPADPTSDEVELLKEVTNLSPGCGAEHCVEFDIDGFLELDPDYFVVSGYRQAPWAIDSLMANITAAYPEDRIIFMELSLHNDGENCTEDMHVNCHGKSMIEVVENYLELGSFLNLEQPAELDQDMKDLCAAATSFAATTKTAQEKGLRVMAAYLSTGTSYFAHATDDMVLRMLEELGMPIMHPGACPDKEACTFDYFWEWIPIGQYFRSCTDAQKEELEFEACNEDPLYPVDFWLYDHRTTPVISTEDFKVAFPDQAIQIGNIGMWPIGGRKITPRHAAQILNNVGAKLNTADRIYDKTACTPADVTSISHRTTGLDAGEYACWDDSFHNSKYFQNCHSDEETSPDVAMPADAAATPEDVTTSSGRSFTDDKGHTFATSAEKPTIVTWAHTAVSMKHYGLDAAQLLGTYGEWYNTGSDIDFEKPEMGSSFPADPTSDEVELLKEVINLSPGCGAEHCVEFDIDGFLELDPDYFVVSGYRQAPWAIDSLMANITAAYPEDRIIFMELSLHNDGENCTEDMHMTCHGKSMIEVVENYLELGSFLNLEQPAELDQDMKDLCAAATSFAATTKTAQEKGLRVMAAYLSTGTSYFAHATDDMVLRMLEELGMPIMHPGACPDKEACTFDYFWEWIPIGQYFRSCTDAQKEELEFEACNEDPLYPVDFWLYDHRTTPVISTEDFKVAFPDQAIQIGNIGMWPIGGRKITPRHAAQILNNVGAKLNTADRIYNKTACTPADVTSISHRTTGLDAGEYACWDDSFHNSKYFQNCHSDEETSPDVAMPADTAATSEDVTTPSPDVVMPTDAAATSEDATTPSDVATLADTITPKSASDTEGQNSGNELFRTNIAGVVATLAMIMML